MVKPILLIKGKGGLGNRILSAVCGLAFADLTGRTPIIDWRDGSYAPVGTNAYPLLFQTPITQKCETYDAITTSVTPAIWAGNLGLTPQEMIEKFAPRSHSNPVAYRKFCVDLGRLDAPENVAVFWSYLPKFKRISRHLRHDHNFATRSEKDIIAGYLAQFFTPNLRILQQVDAAAATFTTPSIGVHIRYTDRKIPLGPIKAALRQKLAQMPDATIFLATDNAHVQTQIASEFPNVQHIEKYLPKDASRLHWPISDIEKVHEAENALTDMWLLSRCDHLIYSRHSTFSVTASYLGNMTLAQLHDVDRYSPLVIAKRQIQAYA
ncbi:Nodulation protein Z (NodZ) [Sulfitobacter marinus]|uniref:Nodulation protein Z (NodZ) n=1 Tax=Sulfitobacter marinus TaxID=394264 RepID=A0A1I6VBX7_9RHOB|nr:NodZ family protein [Sulfitobacter marinus]SFT11243.1 Nodulation protein Z (NodZ) [Sulfitobacter marinus]